MRAPTWKGDRRSRRNGVAIGHPILHGLRIERAQRTLNGFSRNSSRLGTTPAEDWAKYPDARPALIERLPGVVIENRDALAVMAAHDGADTLHYVDPPYMPETRLRGNKFDLKYRMDRHELDGVGHARLLDALRARVGMVALSGYSCPLYDVRLSDWRRIETTTFADGARATHGSAVAKSGMLAAAPGRARC